MPFWLVILAVSIVVILSAVAFYMHWLLYQKRQKTRQSQREQAEALVEKKKKAVQSVDIIGRSYLSKQVEMVEASLRIQRLLDYLDLDETQRSELKVFDEVAAQIAHVPILEEWKALDKKSRATHRQTLERVEREFEDFVKDATTHLLTMLPKQR
ncbi:MAG: hypothetical protein COA42_07000 [Alteromonadaceae bacterium]|nr:MAG: hypothetical protein COA42_07000 [Alteromonadaceae bacterium]